MWKHKNYLQLSVYNKQFQPWNQSPKYNMRDLVHIENSENIHFHTLVLVLAQERQNWYRDSWQ